MKSTHNFLHSVGVEHRITTQQSPIITTEKTVRLQCLFAEKITLLEQIQLPLWKPTINIIPRPFIILTQITTLRLGLRPPPPMQTMLTLLILITHLLLMVVLIILTPQTTLPKLTRLILAIHRIQITLLLPAN